MTRRIVAHREETALAFLVTVGTYQYALMTTAFVNVRLGPANAQVALVTLMLITCAALRRHEVVERLGWQVVAVLAMGIVFLPFKMLADLLHPKGVQSMRLFFTLPLVWALYSVNIVTAAQRARIATIIIWNCVVIALFGLVHFFVFPSVYLGYGDIDTPAGLNISVIPGHAQEAAFFGNPSAYGATLVAGMFAVYLTERRSLPYMAALLVMALGAYVSVSRAAMVFATLLLALYFIGGISAKRIQSWIPIAVMAGAAWYVFTSVPYFGLAMQAAAQRLGLVSAGGGDVVGTVAESVTGGRLPGYKVGVHYMFMDFRHIFLGASDTEEIIMGDINFSDNSFIFLALTFGVPLAVLWVITVMPRALSLSLRRGLRHLLLMFFIGATLFTTPAISWDMWLVYTMGLLLLRPEGALAAATTDAPYGSPRGLPPPSIVPS